jgi:RimJ/RimL family protein N-acetyltransferase
MFAEILTQRLKLRDLAKSDAERIFQYRSQPEVARFQSWGTESVEAIRLDIISLREQAEGKVGSWYQVGIALQSSGELIGDCGFRLLGAELRQAEVGITLASEYQGREYATEALRALLHFLLVTRRMHRVFGSVDPRNVRSLRLMERIGMRKEAHFVRSLWFKGEWVDDVIFAVLASEWKVTSTA